MFVVTKQFDGADGRQYTPGEIVDASEWKNTEKLIRGRWLRPASAEDMASAEEVPLVHTFNKPRSAKKKASARS